MAMVILLFWLGIRLSMPPLYFIILSLVCLCKILKMLFD